MMLRRRHWLAIALAGLAFVGGGGAYLVSRSDLRARLMRTDPDAIPADATLTTFAVTMARPAYKAHCAGCHGADLRGDRTKGAPNLIDREWLYGEGRVAEIERTILYGIRAGNGKTRSLADMPSFGRAVPYLRYAVKPLTPDEIQDVVEFLFVAANRSGDRIAAARGAAIFSGRGQCFDCHEEDARGNSAIGAPNLLDDIWLRGDGSRADIADTIARGLSDFCPAWAPQMSPVAIRALAVFIHAVSHDQVSANAPSG